MSDTEHPDPERWWRWRRRLALWAFAIALAETGYLLHFGGGGPVIAWSYSLWGAIIAAYIGASTWSDIAARR